MLKRIIIPAGGNVSIQDLPTNDANLRQLVDHGNVIVYMEGTKLERIEITYTQEQALELAKALGYRIEEEME